jgi:membrane associated rhomboid family serine protease
LLVNWYIFSVFGKYYREKSGNPAGGVVYLNSGIVSACHLEHWSYGSFETARVKGCRIFLGTAHQNG